MKAHTISVIGLRHGARHVQGFLAANAKKVYAVDLNKELFESLRDKRVEFSQDFHKVLPHSDIVVISLPPALHKEALHAAVKSGVSRIWIEKPLFGIGEDDTSLNSNEHIEVIHELRRCQIVRQWNAYEDLEEISMTWRRPIPPAHDSKDHPIGVVHNLGSHLIDLAFRLTGQLSLPGINEASITFSPDRKNQDAQFSLKFGDIPVRIQVASVEDKDWPDREIEVKLQTKSGQQYIWTSQKSQHRHLTEGGSATKDQIKDEKDWYAPALSNLPTYFTPLETAQLVHKTCNNLVSIMEGQKA